LAVVSVTTDDLKSLEVPMFIAHGDDDQIVPIAASAQNPQSW